MYSLLLSEATMSVTTNQQSLKLNFKEDTLTTVSRLSLIHI